MTKRVYNNQTLPHIYLTHNQDLPTLIASASGNGGVPTPVVRPPAPVTPPVATRPSPALPPTTVSPTPPENLPTVPVSGTPIARPTLPPSTPTPNRPPVTSPQPSTSTVSYRVVVEAETIVQQDQVRAIAPGAFRTLVNGQAVMQAGLFRNRDTADALERQLRAANLQAMVIPVAGWTPPTNPQPLPPIANPGTPNPQTPIARRVVVIDPGHGGRDPGAIGIGGIQEKEIVLAIAQEVASLLERQGVQAVMTRRDDRTLDLEPRVTFAERANADLFVSIHANATASGSNANGAETYYSSGAGRQLAQAIQSNLIQATGMNDRGVKQARFYVLTQTSMPAALVEVGFVTGQQDVRRLSSPTSRSQIAGAITDGILQYIQQSE
ncbi:N-acetylmuramoyl-L-alanine amidase [Oscillatoria sp. FACHB-1407]|nr:N-acetylmuramoyl-L-alanine amidase [Oscillatoria sp. FACHB-1407]